MGQEQKVAVSALNVRILDPDKRDYEALFRSLLRQRNAIRVYSSDYIILTSFRKSHTDRIGFIGNIGRFTDIPEDAEWLDTESLKEAGAEDKESIYIPANLKPNYESFYCGLFEKEHIFAFETFSDSESLSPRHVLKWLKEAVKSKKSIEKFGAIEVDIIPDYGVLEKIITSETLRRIDITIRKPNPDEFTAAQFAKAEKRLAELDAKEERIGYTAEDDEYLDLDDERKALAKVGAENGKVEARLREDGVIKPVSTADKPIEEQEMYDPEDASASAQFVSLALRLIAHVKRNRG